MMENRSFDHMLGYLKLEGSNPNVDGLDAESQTAITAPLIQCSASPARYSSTTPAMEQMQ